MNLRPSITLADADNYFESRLRSNAWHESDDSVKNQALSQSSFLVSGVFVFSDNAYEIQNDEIVWDERIKAAICEEAIWLLEHNPSDIPESLFKGISSANVGGVSATFDKSFICPWICNATRMLVGDLGTFIGDEGSLQVTQLSL